MKFHWIPFMILLFLALVSCSPSQTLNQYHPTLAPKNTNTVTPPRAEATATIPAEMTTATPANAIEAGAWATYQNTQAGYSVQYPSDWTVNEIVGKNGELITTFTMPNNQQGITVSVLNGEAVVGEIPDMPNTRCQQVTVSGLSGRRCFDTIASSISTTFSDHGKQFDIVAFGKYPDQDIYQGFLESFNVTP